MRTDPASARRADTLGLYGARAAANFLGDPGLWSRIEHDRKAGLIRFTYRSGRVRMSKTDIADWYAASCVQTTLDMGGGVTPCAG